MTNQKKKQLKEWNKQIRKAWNTRRKIKLKEAENIGIIQRQKNRKEKKERKFLETKR